MNPETIIQREVMLSLSEAGNLVFRNETGQFWAGKTLHRAGKQVTLGDARMVPCGLCVGSADLIGITPMVITPEMVGQTVGVFTAHEIKTPKGRPTKEQLHFIEVVKAAGGIAGVARSPAEALELLPANNTANNTANKDAAQ